MIKGGRIPIIEVPRADFGFLSMSDFSNKDIKEAFPEILKQYSLGARQRLTNNFSFNSEGLAIGSNPFILTLLNQKNLLPKGENLLSLAQFGRAFNSNPDFFKNTHQVTGIILRTARDSMKRNDYVSQNLFHQL